MTVATGNGPVNALDTALRKALTPLYPGLADMRLVDFKVRILTPQDGSEAITRVMIESADWHRRALEHGRRLANIIDASYEALNDALTWKLLKLAQASVSQ
jgi:2-isopropylmalate synthase